MTTTLSQSILWQMAIIDALWTISWVSYPRLLAIRFLWQIWHWQSCDTSALLPVFGSLTHSDIFGCSIQSTTWNWSGEKIDLFRDLCESCSVCMRTCVHIVKICLQVYLYYFIICLQHVQVRYSMCAVSKCRYVCVLYICIFHSGKLDSEACSTVFSQVWHTLLLMMNIHYLQFKSLHGGEYPTRSFSFASDILHSVCCIEFTQTAQCADELATLH